MFKLLRATVCALLSLCVYPCWCTSHLFVLNKKGIWVASDTAELHDGTPKTACKVVANNGRLLLNTGTFRNVDALQDAERKLSLDSSLESHQQLTDLLAASRQPGKPVTIIVLEFRKGAPWADFLQIDETGNLIRPLPGFHLSEGVPHGSGLPEIVDKFYKDAAKDPTIAARIAKAPKSELLKVLDKEANCKPSDSPQCKRGQIGPPYTVLLFKADGSIEDKTDPKAQKLIPGVCPIK